MSDFQAVGHLDTPEIVGARLFQHNRPEADIDAIYVVTTRLLMNFSSRADMFRYRLPILLFVSSQVILNPASAVNGDTRPAELATANDKLNKAYKSLMTQLEQKDREKLKNAQRIWISMRDADCKWASPAEPLDCMIDLTDRRTDELRTSMFNASNGKYTSLELQ